MSSRPKRIPRNNSHGEQEAPPFNVRAPSFFVVTDHCRCWKCSGVVDVYALGVAPPFTLLERTAPWREGTRLAILSYVERLPASISNHLAQRAPRFFCDESQWHQRPYWMNHCQHCDAKIGDYETIESLLAPFNAQKFNAAKLTLTFISEKFEAVALINKQTARQHPPNEPPSFPIKEGVPSVTGR